MVGLTFKQEHEDGLVGLTKTRTTRFNLEYQLKMAGYDKEEIADILRRSEWGPVECPARGERRLHLWLGSPRQMHRWSWIRKLGISKPRYIIDAVKGRDFTEKMALEDGFGTVQEFKKALMELHEGLTMATVERHTWVSFRIDWEEGPHA